MIIDQNLYFSQAQAIGGTLLTDTISTNVIDLAPTQTANVAVGGDIGPGEKDIPIFVNFTAPFIPSVGPDSLQVVLQTDNNSAFSTDLPTEYPLTGPLNVVVPTAIAALSNGVMTITTIGASPTIQVGMQLFTGTLAAPVPTGIFITGQLTGTPGGSNGATFSVSSLTSTITPTVLSNVWTGKQVAARIPANGMKRYMRLAYRTAGTAGTFTGTASAAMILDPQNQQIAPSGFAVL